MDQAMATAIQTPTRRPIIEAFQGMKSNWQLIKTQGPSRPSSWNISLAEDDENTNYLRHIWDGLKPYIYSCCM